MRVAVLLLRIRVVIMKPFGYGNSSSHFLFVWVEMEVIVGVSGCAVTQDTSCNYEAFRLWEQQQPIIVCVGRNGGSRRSVSSRRLFVVGNPLFRIYLLSLGRSSELWIFISVYLKRQQQN